MTVCIEHYSNNQNILLVGEGDFSFALSLATIFGSATNIVATSKDSKAQLLFKHSTASDNVEDLEDYGCTIVHGVDCHIMTRHRLLRNQRFDRIIFNFPHAGFFGDERESVQISRHQRLVTGFFNSARVMLEEDGEVHITHKDSYPFNLWGIESLASYCGLSLVEKAPFSRWDYPGYINKRGDGHKSNRTFPVGECYTFMFADHQFSRY